MTTELATPNNVSGGLASFTANIARIFTANKHTVTILLSTVKESEITFDDNIVLEKVFIKNCGGIYLIKLLGYVCYGKKSCCRNKKIFCKYLEEQTGKKENKRN